MKYPNLSWAIRERWLTHYRVAAANQMSESAFSRALNGVTNFTSGQKAKIAQILNYPRGWLFQEVQLPRMSRSVADSTAPAPIHRKVKGGPGTYE